MRSLLAGAVLTLLVLTGAPGVVEAHGVAERDARLLESIDGLAIGPLLYLGAKHMVTGYDHLLFLAGVVFYLYRLRHVVMYVSLFTLGHSATLLAGALGGLRVDPFLVDAVIGLSVVYKAFENMGGFTRLLGRQPDSRLAVLVFGLFHGLGLATKLQDLTLSSNGLVGNIISFNVGVEIGQVLALTVVLLALTFWRRREGFARHAFAANGVLMSGGFLLAGYQLAGFFLAPR
jgi:hypothetical protein